MKLPVILATLLLAAIPNFCQAHIARSCDNLYDKIQYTTKQNVGWGGIVDCFFLKEVDSKDIDKYYIRLGIMFADEGSKAVKYLVEPIINVTIDDKQYQIHKVTDGSTPRCFVSEFYRDECYYLISDEIINAIKSARKLTFVATVPGKDPYVINFEHKCLAETKNIIDNAHFKDYTKDIDSMTNKYKINDKE